MLTDADVRHLRNVLEDARAHRLTRQSFERGRADEAKCGLGGDHPNGVTCFGELPNDRARLVSSDPAGDADDDLLAFGH